MNIYELVKNMTIDEKAAQLSQFEVRCFDENAISDPTGPAHGLGLTDENISSAGSLLNTREAETVIRIQREHLKRDRNKIPLLFMRDVIHGYRTIYPIQLALGASFDTELVKRCSQMAAKESYVSGINVTFAPMVDLVRDARWGRDMESTGEDPFLNADMARAQVEGYQGDFGKNCISSCIKHFACYGAAEAGRDYNSVDMSEHTLRQYYLQAYKAGIDAGSGMVMTSFNTLNGVPSSGNKYLVNDILRKEWGYDGVVISDYNAFREMVTHGYCENNKEAAKRAMDATSDIEMMSNCYINYLPELINEGKISMEQVDEAVIRILKLKEKLGLFENPYGGASSEDEKKVHLCPEHRALAKESAEKCAVLLKNDGVLPLSKKLKKIALIGPFAKVGMIGSWCCWGTADEATTAYDGIKAITDAEILYCEGASSDFTQTIDEAMDTINEAVSLAKDADAVVLCVGEHAKMSGESFSRANIEVPVAQVELIKRVCEANKNTVVTLYNGRGLALTNIVDIAPAIMTMWQPGTEGGSALAELIFGEVNFSAKLPVTFPRSVGQCPIYYNYLNTGRPKLGEDDTNIFCSRYIDEKNSPLFPFGYGLSYSSFEISKITLSKDSFKSGESIMASVTVKNTSDVEGVETVQMYLNDTFASLTRPLKELRGYKKVHLMPGEEKVISFEINEDTLKFFTASGKYEAEAGSFILYIGASSETDNSVGFRFE